MIGDLSLNDVQSVRGVFAAGATAMRASPLRSGCNAHLPSHGRLLTTGDLHDNQDHLRKIVALAKLDESPDHHVVLHEIIHGERLINGMDFSYRMLARVAELVVRYPAQVHPIIANHEMSQLTGAGVSKGAGNSVELFNDALEYVFGDSWVEVNDAIREFIRAMPLAVVGGKVHTSTSPQVHKADEAEHRAVLCAHSLPDEIAMRWFDVNIFHRELTDEDYRGPTGSAYSMVWGRRYSPSQVESLAEQWGIALFCLGHQHVEEGVRVINDRAIVLNSDHERAAAVPVNLGSVPSAREAAANAIWLASVR